MGVVIDLELTQKRSIDEETDIAVTPENNNNSRDENNG